MKAAYPLHILMTADAVGGVWQYALTLASELADCGHRITLAVLGPAVSVEQREQAAVISGLSLLETGLALDWLADGPEPVEQAARELADLARRRGVDLVHCNSPAVMAAAPFPVPIVAVAHGCVATWWRAARDEPLDPQFDWHARMMRAGLRAADAVVAPSDSFGQTLRETYGLSQVPIVVHNGRAPLGTGDRMHQLDAALTVGRLWDPVKNARVLDRAAAQIEGAFLAAGTLRGPHGEEYAPQNLQCLGHQSEAALARLLDLKPVFVSAASFEPFGLAVLEAASAGCALVLSDIPTFRELWEGAALFVDSEDSAGFAAAIASLMNDRDRRNAVGAAARERSAHYTPAASAERMIAIYQAALAAQEVAA